ncbi:MAG TPA: PQQ-dependent sugar dehydrogenase, partial [Myxococcota bacterium]|nr:PQQ-dependent sugar dehydrogenase [Myxococcota bacterium]
MHRFLLLMLLVAVPSVSAPASAVSVQRLVSGLNQPMFVTAPAGDSRLFIVERGGKIRIFENGALRSTPFLDISGRVLARNEGGLLGLAFPSDYATTKAFYVYYTTPGTTTSMTSHISRFRASSTDPNVATGEEKILLALSQPWENHNGGTVAFGGDGMLYMGFGDGGDGGDPREYAQKPDTLLGKMIRIDVRHSSFTENYRIPSDNPFVGNGAYKSEIWSLGWRNPFRFSFDRQTGDMYVGDVGQNAREEVDVESASDPGGRNYGWDVKEGTRCYEEPDGVDPSEPPCNSTSFTDPVHEYDHGAGCSITGGHVYRGSQTSIRGHYFFADYCSSKIWSFVWNGGSGISGSVADRTAEFTPPSGQGSIGNPVAFGEDGFGELHIVDPGGEIFRVVPASAPACGNGRSDPGEQCDDGNATSGDGCDANCRLTGCGNGLVTSGEQCDDGNQTSGDGCDSNCKRTACGNGIVTSGEQCDDGNQTSGDGC